ncbi:unnamed protein product [Lactuca saligna]|uniref:Uncharacterized protein n=1 Tax=Lactuca saligna TaxID=75948 RepID=A0AA35VKN0_LACSI|nr:unnamed protein product [Lactuca saligna]
MKRSRKLIIATTSTEDGERIPETPEADLVKDSSIPEDISVIPPEVSHVNSSNEETRTSDITIGVSNIDTNVNMGEEGAKTDAQVSSLEVDTMLKMLESRIISIVSGMVKDSESVILEKVDYTDQNNELHVKSQRSDFMGEVM